MRLSTLFPIAALLCAHSLTAQTVIAKTITFEGAPQYSSAELLAMSGLSLGQTLNKDQIETALHKLDDSGQFANISYTTQGTALHIVLEPMARSQARSLRFTNFVLDTPDELTVKLHARLPLFDGSIPVNGGMQAQIERALEAIEKDHGVDAKVASIGGPGNALDYTIVSPPVVVGAIAINGADLASDPRLAAFQARVVGSEYVEGISGDALRTNLVDAYQDLGYQDVEVGRLGHGAPSATPTRIAVSLTGSANPGPLYRVASVTLAGSAPGVEPARLEEAIQLKPGAPASRIESLSTVARLDGAYANRGYLDAKSAAEPVKDTSAHTVAYTFRTAPGEVYHVRSFTTSGTTPAQAGALEAAWKLPVGAAFDGGAISALEQNFGLKSLCGGKPPAVALKPDAATHQVDLVASCGAGHPAH